MDVITVSVPLCFKICCNINFLLQKEGIFQTTVFMIRKQLNFFKTKNKAQLNVISLKSYISPFPNSTRGIPQVEILELCC